MPRLELCHASKDDVLAELSPQGSSSLSSETFIVRPSSAIEPLRILRRTVTQHPPDRRAIDMPRSRRVLGVQLRCGRRPTPIPTTTSIWLCSDSTKRRWKAFSGPPYNRVPLRSPLWILAEYRLVEREGLEVPSYGLEKQRYSILVIVYPPPAVPPSHRRWMVRLVVEIISTTTALCRTQ